MLCNSGLQLCSQEGTETGGEKRLSSHSRWDAVSLSQESVTQGILTASATNINLLQGPEHTNDLVISRYYSMSLALFCLRGSISQGQNQGLFLLHFLFLFLFFSSFSSTVYSFSSSSFYFFVLLFLLLLSISFFSSSVSPPPSSCLIC